MGFVLPRGEERSDREQARGEEGCGPDRGAYLPATAAWQASVLPEPPVCKCLSGTRLQIVLEFLRFSLVGKRVVADELPGFVFGGVSGFSGIMVNHPLLQISSITNIPLCGIGFALEQIHIEQF